MRERKRRMNAGGVLIVLIIIVISLSVFALLSVRSSMNALSLVKKNADSVKIYYVMDTRATDILAEIDTMVKRKGNAGFSVDSFSDITAFTETDIRSGKVKSLSYEVVNGRKVLSVKISYDGTELIVDRWRLRTETDESEYTIELPD